MNQSSAISTEPKVRRPLLRYHGGKFLLAPWIISHFSPHRIYVEPYGGAASVLLRKPRSYAEIYNDLDGEIVNVFRIARDRGDELREKLRLTPFARAEYYAAFEPCDDPLESARKTIIRSFMGHGSDSICRMARSGFRADSQRSGTTAAHDWMHFPDALNAIIERLRGVVIENREAVGIMERFDGLDTLHYVDPPYVRSTRSNSMHGDRGYRHEMTDDQHAELCDFLKTLKGQAVVSGYPNEIYDKALAGWSRVEKPAMADGARPRTEVLWINRPIKQQLIAGLT